MSGALESNPEMLRPLGLNQGGYQGEQVDMAALVDETVSAASARGWSVETLPFGEDQCLYALHRVPSNPTRRFYFSTGMHGDEPAGPLAVHELIERDLFPADAACWVLPCLNPSGFALQQRENHQGIDLNRDFLKPQSSEVQALTAWLQDKGRFDCAVCLHEDWESKGFYLYAVNPRELPCVSEAIVESVRSVFPIDESEEIEGFPASRGVIQPPADPIGRDIWPETLYLTNHHTDLGYTLETSSDFTLSSRREALVVAVRTILERVP